MRAQHIHKQNKLNEKYILTKAVIRMADHLNLTRQELTEIIGLSEATFSRIFKGQIRVNKALPKNKIYSLDPASKEGQLAILLLKLYRHLDILFGGNAEQCALWLRSNNKHLQGKPIDLIKSIQGMVIVIQYLESVRGN